LLTCVCYFVRIQRFDLALNLLSSKLYTSLFINNGNAYLAMGIMMSNEKIRESIGPSLAQTVQSAESYLDSALMHLSKGQIWNDSALISYYTKLTDSEILEERLRSVHESTPKDSENENLVRELFLNYSSTIDLEDDWLKVKQLLRKDPTDEEVILKLVTTFRNYFNGIGEDYTLFARRIVKILTRFIEADGQSSDVWRVFYQEAVRCGPKFLIRFFEKRQMFKTWERVVFSQKIKQDLANAQEGLSEDRLSTWEMLLTTKSLFARLFYGDDHIYYRTFFQFSARHKASLFERFCQLWEGEELHELKEGFLNHQETLLKKMKKPTKLQEKMKLKKVAMEERAKQLSQKQLASTTEKIVEAANNLLTSGPDVIMSSSIATDEMMMHQIQASREAFLSEEDDVWREVGSAIQAPRNMSRSRSRSIILSSSSDEANERTTIALRRTTKKKDDQEDSSQQGEEHEGARSVMSSVTPSILSSSPTSGSDVDEDDLYVPEEEPNEKRGRKKKKTTASQSSSSSGPKKRKVTSSRGTSESDPTEQQSQPTESGNRQPAKRKRGRPRKIRRGQS